MWRVGDYSLMTGAVSGGRLNSHEVYVAVARTSALDNNNRKYQMDRRRRSFSVQWTPIMSAWKKEEVGYDKKWFIKFINRRK